MARRRRPPPPERRPNPAADAVDALVGELPAKRKPPAMTAARLAKAVVGIQRRMKERDWENLRPSDIVAAHAWCHGETYGAADGDLLGQGWGNACRAVGLMIKREFAGDAEEALGFLRWAWEREMRREKKRRNEGQDGEGRRLTWSFLFRKKFVLTDYRVELGRRQEAGR